MQIETYTHKKVRQLKFTNYTLKVSKQIKKIIQPDFLRKSNITHGNSQVLQTHPENNRGVVIK